MTELELYKFVHYNECSIDTINKNKTVLQVHYKNVKKFIDMIFKYRNTKTLELKVMKDYFIFDLSDICNYYNIDINNIIE